MMFGSAVHMSTAVGCPATTSDGHDQQQQNYQKLPKCRYGAYYSAMMAAEQQREEEEYFAKRKALKAAAAATKKRADEQQQQRGPGLSKRLLSKLVRLIQVKDFASIVGCGNGKTFPSREAKKAAAAAAAAAARRSHHHHNSSQSSSTLSGSFEPMPTIEEETESELICQQWLEGEQEEEQEDLAWQMEREEARAAAIVYAAAEQEWSRHQPEGMHNRGDAAHPIAQAVA